MVLPLRLTLSTIPAFRNPAVRGLFEGFHSSLATPFFRVTHWALAVQGNAQHSDGSLRYLFVHPCVWGKFPSVKDLRSHSPRNLRVSLGSTALNPGLLDSG